MRSRSVCCLAAAGLVAVMAACAPQVNPLDIYVNPQTQERTCVQSYGDTQLGGYSVVLTNDVGHFQLILTRNFMRANQNRLSAERAESNVPVAIRFPEGAVREYRPRGTGNKQSRSVSHDVITIQEIDESVVRRLLGTRSNIEVTYSGRHGSETFTIRPNTWVALSEGFGQYCMG